MTNWQLKIWSRVLSDFTAGGYIEFVQSQNMVSGREGEIHKERASAGIQISLNFKCQFSFLYVSMNFIHCCFPGRVCVQCGRLGRQRVDR